MISVSKKRHSAPFLELNLRRIRSCLRRDELFEIANSVIGTAFDADYKCTPTSKIATQQHIQQSPRGKGNTERKNVSA
jgi:hypothetical protein